MKVRILGCGPSGGVPLIGNRWVDCDPTNPKNRRLRSSILVSVDQKQFLIDTSPDLRAQLLAADVGWVDAVFYTHVHGDHVHGLNDLMVLNRIFKKKIPVYGAAETLADIKHSFNYAFQAQNGYQPFLDANIITPNIPFEVQGVRVLPFEQDHGEIKSLGFRIGDFAYSTDVNHFSEAAFQALEGVKVWVLDCLQYNKHTTHSHLEQALTWVERVKPEKVYLTHLGPLMDYDALMNCTPLHVEPAYDGLEILI